MLALFRLFIGGVFLKTLDSMGDAIKEFLWKHRKIIAIRVIQKWLRMETPDYLSAAFFDDSQDGDFAIDEAEITAAINKNLNIKAVLGIEFTNIFSREAIKDDLNKLGLARINQILGASEDNPIITSFRDDALRSSVRGFMGAQAMEAVSNGSSRIIDSDGADRIVAAAMNYERNYEKYKPDPPKPLIMTPKAISNRERQARYRATHTRHWEPR